ncbi:glutathione binding-like protein, partial [Paraburkholderia sp. SIMBA_053]
PQPIEYAINRYTNETKRLYGVMDTKLGKTRYLAGDDYTIADIATFPWTRSWQNQGLQIDEFPNVKRWHEEIAARPAVQRGVEVLASARVPLMDEKAKEILFGATQYAKH